MEKSLKGFADNHSENGASVVVEIAILLDTTQPFRPVKIYHDFAALTHVSCGNPSPSILV